jgi:hypothetical protein
MLLLRALECQPQSAPSTHAGSTDSMSTITAGASCIDAKVTDCHAPAGVRGASVCASASATATGRTETNARVTAGIRADTCGNTGWLQELARAAELQSAATKPFALSPVPLSPSI